jgi:hypothetical protein
MPGQSGLVAPGAGVVDHDGVVDTVLGVVDLGGRVGLDDVDLVAVANQLALVVQHPDGAAERPVHRVAPQQARTLVEIVRAIALADHDGAQPQHIAAAGLLDQDAGQQPADAAEAVEHHVLGLRQRLAHGADVVADHLLEIIPRRASGGLLLVPDGELADIDMGRTQIHAGQCLDHREGVEFRQFVLLDLAHETVRLHQIGDRPVDHVAAVHVEGDVVLPIQPADQRNHGLGQRLARFPVLEEVLRLRSFHLSGSPAAN